MSERQRWMLKRGSHEPMVWPFETEEQADDFKLDHGMLDWRTERVDDPEKEHEAICARDSERWPCQHVRVESHAKAIEYAARNRCHRCGKQIGWQKITFKGAGDFGEDLRYHGKLGACFNEARRLAEERQDEGALKDIARIEQSREETRRWRRERDAASAEATRA